MLPQLIPHVREFVEAPEAPDVPRAAQLLHRLLKEARQIKLSDIDVPYGRYLIHADPENRFNLQLDVFSRGYTGGIHAHGAWGMLFVLRGALYVEDYQDFNGKICLARSGYMGAGGGQAFCPPVADWHRVSTDTEGLQTVSIHVYGNGFDMDTGIGMDAQGQQRSYKRGPLGNPDLLKGLFLS